MSDDFSDLENELRRLRPRTLRPELLTRLAADSPDAQTASKSAAIVWLWPVLGAAAAVAFAGVVLKSWDATGTQALDRPHEMAAGPVDPQTGPARLTPVSATNVFYGGDVERTVQVADDLKAQQVRLHYVDTITWRDPRRNASIQWTVPREEVLLVPVQAQ